MNEELLEKLSDLEHEQFCHWTKYFLENLTEENISRWKKQIETPYSKLSEKEKESDREWARKVISIIFNEELSSEKIKEIKSTIEDSDIDIEESDMNELKDLRKVSDEDSINLGILYCKCYNFMKKYSSIEEIKNIIILYEPKKELTDLIEDYKTDYGKYYIGLRIKEYIRGDKKRISYFIELFFNIFSEE
jgi:hypothetical protein